jgi:hypothetical protein
VRSHKLRSNAAWAAVRSLIATYPVPLTDIVPFALQIQRECRDLLPGPIVDAPQKTPMYDSDSKE